MTVAQTLKNTMFLKCSPRQGKPPFHGMREEAKYGD